MARDLVQQAKDMRNRHRGESFNINYVPNEIIKRIADNFINHKVINVDSIKSISKVVQYMIAARIVGFDRLYFDLCEVTGHELDKFCEDIEVEDNCYDGFDNAVERHLYRANPRIYEYLKTKHIRVLDGGLVKYRKTCHDIFLPDYKAIVDVSTYHAELEVKELIENTQKEYVDFASTYKLHSVGNFEYIDNKLRCTGEGGDPVNLNDSYIYDCIVDTNYDLEDWNLNNFKLDGAANGISKIHTYRKIKIDQLKQYDKVYLKGGLVYHDEKQKCYMIVGPHEFIHLTKFDNLTQKSLVYSFIDKYGKHIDLIRLTNLSCDTVDWETWLEDHAEDSVQDGFVYLAQGRTLANKIKNPNVDLSYEEVKNLLESI